MHLEQDHLRTELIQHFLALSDSQHRHRELLLEALLKRNLKGTLDQTCYCPLSSFEDAELAEATHKHVKSIWETDAHELPWGMQQARNRNN